MTIVRGILWGTVSATFLLLATTVTWLYFAVALPLPAPPHIEIAPLRLLGMLLLCVPLSWVGMTTAYDRAILCFRQASGSGVLTRITAVGNLSGRR